MGLIANTETLPQTPIPLALAMVAFTSLRQVMTAANLAVDRSSSGCLLSHQFDAAEVMVVIAGEVTPWLESDRAPVEGRATTPS